MAVVVCASMLANAASFNWKLQTGLDYVGMNVFAVKNTTASVVLATLSASVEENWIGTFTGLDSYEVTGTNARAGAVGQSTDIAASDNLVFVIVNGEVKEGSNFWVVNDFSIPAANVFEPPATGTQLTVQLSNVGLAGNGTFTTTAVPEPASAMLALAGVAMLIRRRK